MRYVMFVTDHRSNTSGVVREQPRGTATTDEMAAIDAFNDSMKRDGFWVLACGLADPSASLVVDARGPVPSATEGPMHAHEPYISGMWIIEVPDHDTAVRLATEGSRACNRVLELRAFL